LGRRFSADSLPRRFRVIRFDNRDIGKSSHLFGGSRITLAEFLKAEIPENSGRAPYKLRDMAEEPSG